MIGRILAALSAGGLEQNTLHRLPRRPRRNARRARHVMFLEARLPRGVGTADPGMVGKGLAGKAPSGHPLRLVGKRAGRDRDRPRGPQCTCAPGSPRRSLLPLLDGGSRHDEVFSEYCSDETWAPPWSCYQRTIRGGSGSSPATTAPARLWTCSSSICMRIPMNWSTAPRNLSAARPCMNSGRACSPTGTSGGLRHRWPPSAYGMRSSKLRRTRRSPATSTCGRCAAEYFSRSGLTLRFCRYGPAGKRARRRQRSPSRAAAATAAAPAEREAQNYLTRSLIA